MSLMETESILAAVRTGLSLHRFTLHVVLVVADVTVVHMSLLVSLFSTM